MNTAEKLTAIAENQEKVYDKGRQDEWSDFWDSYQDYGRRVNYGEAFGRYATNSINLWNDVSYKPKHDMYPTVLDRSYSHSRITDLKSIHENLGIKFDTSKCYIFHFCFSGAWTKQLPEISCIATTDVYYTFASMPYLHTIDKVIVNDKGDTKFTGAFNESYYLKNILFEGVIGQNISFASCPLTCESMKSVISCLKNYSSENTGVHTITFKDQCKTALEAEGATSPNGNLWTEYVSDLGWVLA